MRKLKEELEQVTGEHTALKDEYGQLRDKHGFVVDEKTGAVKEQVKIHREVVEENGKKKEVLKDQHGNLRKKDKATGELVVVEDGMTVLQDKYRTLQEQHEQLKVLLTKKETNEVKLQQMAQTKLLEESDGE